MTLGLNSLILRTRGYRKVDPRFVHLTDTLMNEHSAPGTIVGALSVRNGAGSGYSFTLDDDAGGRFAISADGHLVAGLVDTEFDDGASWNVQVRSHRVNETDVTRSFVISIVEIETAVPTIIVTPRSGFAAGVTQSTPVDTVIYDLDVSVLANFTFFEGADPDNKFAVVARTVVLTAALDSSVKASHSLTINVTDEETGDVFTRTISVPVLAAAPTSFDAAWAAGFEQQVLFESTPVPSVLATLSITPALSGYTYSIVSNAIGNPFAVVGSELRLVSAVDFEEQFDPTITIRVSNGIFSVDMVIDFVVAPGAPLATRYIKPAGTGNGSSLNLAASITTLNSMIAGTLPGGQVRVISDLGVYTRTAEIRLSVGGTVSQPILVAGYDSNGNRKQAEAVGNRTPWTLPADPDLVTDTRAPFVLGSFNFLRVNAGASNLTFRDILVRNFAIGARLRANNSNLIFDNFSAYNVRRLIDNDTGTIVGLSIINFTVTGNSRDAIRIQGPNTRNVLIEDFHINSGRQSGDSYANGISLLESVHDVIIRASDPGIPFICENVQDGHEKTGGVGYWNGDGIAIEGTCWNILIQDGILRGCTDGGLDSKGANVTVLRVLSEDNKRNFRFWGTPANIAIEGQTMKDCISRNPHFRGGTSGLRPTHLGTYNGVDLLIDNFIAEDTDTTAYVFDSESSADILRFKSYDVSGSLGHVKDIPVAAVQYDPMVDDGVLPNFTVGAVYDVDEGVVFIQQLTTDESEVVTYRKLSGDFAIDVSRDGLVAMGAKDFEAPQDAGKINVYHAVVRVRDSARNARNISLAITVNDVAGDTGGSVVEGDTFGWRLSHFFSDPGNNVSVTGPEHKTITKTVGGSYMSRRSTTAFYPPVHRLTYFEAVPGTIGTPANFSLGLSNSSATSTAALGSSNHSVGYSADGAVHINGVTVATLATYAANDVIGFATDIGHWDWQDVRDNPSHIHDWKKRLLWIYKNGVLVSAVGGIDISVVIDALYATVSLYDLNDSATLRSTADEWTETPRAGHTAWGLVKQLIPSGFAARYVRHNGGGLGSSWADAASIRDITLMIASASAGGAVNPHVFIRGDELYYLQTAAIDISHGGASTPVTVIGVTEDLIPIPATTIGNRTDWVLPNNPQQVTTGTNTWAPGQNLFNLHRGANNITFSHIRGANHSALFYFDRRADNVIIEEVNFYNCRRGLVEGVAGDYSSTGTEDGDIGGYINSAPRNCTVRRFHGTGNSKPSVHFRSQAFGILIEYGHLNGGRQTEDSWSNGVKFSEHAYGNTVRFVWGFNHMEEQDNGAFVNGDAIEINNLNDDCHIEDCVGAYARDSGFDSKSDGGTVKRSLSYNCIRMKLWGSTMKIDDVFIYGAAQPVFHRGQNTEVSDITFNRLRVYDGVQVRIEGPHAVSRFLDCVRIMGSSFTIEPLSNVPDKILADDKGSSRNMFGTAADVTAPVITTKGHADIVQGYPLEITLGANEEITWQFKDGLFDPSAETDYALTGVDVFHPEFGIEKFLNNNPVMKYFQPIVYDAVTPANNTKSCVLQAVDAAGNIGEKAFSFTILEHYIFSDAEAEAYSTLVGTFTESQKQSIDNAFRSLKYYGLWNDIVEIQDYRYSLRGWKGVYDATLIGTPSFSSTLGVSTNGTNNGIDTNVPGTALPQNGCWFAWHDRGSPAIDNARIGNWDGTDGDLLNPRRANGSTRFRIRQIGDSAGDATSGGSALHFVNRSASNAVQLYRNGGARSVTSGNTAPSVAPNAGTFKIGQLGNGGGWTVTVGSMFAAGSASFDANKAAQFYGIMVGNLVAPPAQALTDLGKVRSDAPYPSNVWAMEKHPTENRVYVGTGNSSNNQPNINAGSGDLKYIDLGTNAIVTSPYLAAAINEEQIDKFKIIDGNLVFPGIDPRSGSPVYFHRLESGTWAKHQVGSDEHCFDIDKIGSNWVAARGTDNAGFWNIFSKSAATDGVGGWSDSQSSGGAHMGTRASYLFQHTGVQYATTLNIGGEPTIAQWDGSKFVSAPFTKAQVFPGGSTAFTQIRLAKRVGTSLVYIGAVDYNDSHWHPVGLYTATASFAATAKVTLQVNELPWDLKVRGSTAYVLTSRLVSSGPQVFEIRVLSSVAPFTAWTEVVKFSRSTFARSFEEYNGAWFFGLGTDRGTSLEESGQPSYTDTLKTESGTILRWG